MISEIEKMARKLLGVDEEADALSIKKSYRHLALKYHPDANNEANTEKFILITEAYEYLVENKIPDRNSAFYHRSVVDKEDPDESYHSWMEQFGSVI